MPQRISISPSPPKAGDTAEVCYDFDGLSITTGQLKITWDLIGGTTKVETITVTADSPCSTVTVPANAGLFLISDLSGNSPELTGGVDS